MDALVVWCPTWSKNPKKTLPAYLSAAKREKFTCGLCHGKISFFPWTNITFWARRNSSKVFVNWKIVLVFIKLHTYSWCLFEYSAHFKIAKICKGRLRWGKIQITNPKSIWPKIAHFSTNHRTALQSVYERTQKFPLFWSEIIVLCNC